MKNINQHVQDIIRLTAEIIERCGPRLAGTPACGQAARMLAQEFKKHCESVALEEFKLHPRAFLGYLKINTIIYLLASLALYFGYIYFAAAGFIACHLINTWEFHFYREFIDFLFKTKTGYNVIGRIEPRYEAKQQIIISGHHDSANIFRYLSHAPWFYVFLIVSSTLANGLITISLMVWIGYQAIFGVPLFPFAGLKYISPIIILLNAPFLFFLKSTATPGAGDNLAASCLLNKAAELFSNQHGKFSNLQHTRLILASFDGEEAGLRGSRAFARKYREEFRRIPTYNLNLESLFDVNQIKYLVRDMNGTVRLSRPLAEECCGLTRHLGYKARLFSLKYGYGATDAAELTKAGVQATSLLALDSDFKKGKVVYHTERDRAENLDPAVIKAALEVTTTFIIQKDRLT
jgi:hypothetical protein